MLRSVLFALLALFAVRAFGQDDCAIVSPEALDQIFPEHAPWGVMSGGTGRCKFHSDESRPINFASIVQDIKGSQAEAEEVLTKLRGNAAKQGFVVESVPSLGKNAFSYRSASPEPAFSGTMYFVSNDKNVVVLAWLSMQKPVHPTYVEGGIRFARAGLGIGGNTAAQAAVKDCPWFTNATLQKLLPGPGFKAQSYGENSCKAEAGDRVVIATIMAAADADLLQKATGATCKSEPVPALGAKGLMRYGCTGGNPNARVSMVAGAHYVEYAFAPGREPTAAERALLIELAEKARERAK